LNLNLNENLKINEIIKIAINAFNEKFEEDKLKIRLSVEYKRYNIKQSKKNGSPKDDLPSK
jgi:hypothetical protein